VPPAGTVLGSFVAAAPPAAAAPKATRKLPAPKTPVEAAVQQVVMLERNGHPIAIGTPLNGDGRILTALSPLAHGNQLIAIYPEGQRIPVRLSHSDRGWDLALLTPEGDAPRLGLKGSREPAAAGSKLHAVNHLGGRQLGSSGVTIKSKRTLLGCDSAELPDAYELGFAPRPIDLGGPIVSDQGEVVAIIARACAVADKAGCTLAAYGAPVTAVRDFLRSAPARRSSWVGGLEVAAFDAGIARGVRITAVAAEGPAASSGLRAGPPGVGDVVLAVDGKPVATALAFAAAVDDREPGAPARLMVLTDGHYREVLLPLLAPTNTLAPARDNRILQSNPPGTAPEPQVPTSLLDPYR